MRLFIGINFQECTRAALISLCDDLRAKMKSGRFTSPENLHLTLAFLGECDDMQRKQAQAVIGALAFAPFPIEVNRLGCFRRSGGDIWWAGLKESKPLEDLQATLTKQLIMRGFSLESRKFSPHITLARQAVTQEQPRIITPFSETVTGIDLIESTRVNGKLTYTTIYRKEADDVQR